MNFFISFFCSNSFSFKHGVYYDVFHLLSFIVSFTHSGYFALADRIYIYIALLMRNAVEFKSQSCGFRFLFFSMSLHFVFFFFCLWLPNSRSRGKAFDAVLICRGVTWWEQWGSLKYTRRITNTYIRIRKYIARVCTRIVTWKKLMEEYFYICKNFRVKETRKQTKWSSHENSIAFPSPLLFPLVFLCMIFFPRAVLWIIILFSF